MSGPSAAILKNTIDLYAFVPVQDEDAGIAGSTDLYPRLSATIKCSVQPGDVSESLDSQNRVVATRTYRFLTDFNNARLIPNLNLKYKAVWVDAFGASHSIFIDGGWTDQAGRGVAFRALGLEKV